VNIHQLLLEYYLAWQKDAGEDRPWKEFAKVIGIDNAYLNKIYNGKRKAGSKTIRQLADYFNDPRFYDAAALDRPEPLLSYTRRNWGSVPDEVKKRIAEDISRYTSEPIPDKNDRTKTA
jgi:transcriptional regulator with XRE-family HTH domain